MPSPGSGRAAVRVEPDQLRLAAPGRPPAEILCESREHERAGRILEAIHGYQAAAAAAECGADGAVQSEALRRLAIQRCHRDEAETARVLCRRSYEVARASGHDELAAEALNTLGVVDLTTGSLAEARTTLLEALALGGGSRALTARVEQNLGIIANIQGELDEAQKRYRRSLEAYDASRDQHGCAIAYHNLGMICADRGQLEKADRYFRQSREIAEQAGDVHLEALCLVNQAEVDVARQRFENARQGAEYALNLLEQLGARGAKADAYRVIGMVYRETGRPALAESRLRAAIDLAVAAGSVLNEAEACRELAVLYQVMGRNHEALELLGKAYRLFRRLDARTDLVHVGGKVAELQGTYLAVVRSWGKSIESSDSFTFGHCERVAQSAVAAARVLGLDAEAETTILLGAYLHDLGLVRVPHEILTKPGPLTREEREIAQKHPIWGIELLASVEFPWDIKPIIRSHHEKYDGSGYPDGLTGDEIPVSAQIVGIAEVFDALTNPRSGQPALPLARAIERLTQCRKWWADRVFEAFLKTIATVT
jgi:putative nucleotidyltransferase with HDIG domain